VLDPRRRLARFAPRLQAGLAALLAAAAVAAVLAALRAPRALDAAALAAVLAAAWQASPGVVRRRRLPPGSLALSRSIEAVVDRDFYARERRRRGPIFKLAQFHRPVAHVVGLELAHDLFRRHHQRLAPTQHPWTAELNGGFLRYMDNAHHDVYGPLFRAALSAAVVAAGEATTRRAARRELAALAASAPSGGVAPDRAIDRIVFAAFARVLFGLDAAGDAFATLARGHAILLEQKLSAPFTARSRDALADLRALVARRADELRTATAAGDRPVCALEQLGRADPGLPDAVCVDNLLGILRASTDNVGALLRWTIKILGEHPRWSERLRRELEDERHVARSPAGGGADPDPAGACRAPRLADRIVMETLRLAQSEYQYRVVREDFEYEGFRFPAGWLLRVCVRESHGDESIWPDPEAFDPDRFLERAVPHTRYSPFGFHRHACNGVDLNNMICRVTLEELTAGFDWKIVRDGPLERDFQHWSHWRPSSKLAIAIAPASA
jgi:cytochrome P450